MAASKDKAKKFIRSYSIVCTIAVSIWLVFTVAKLITVTGDYVHKAVHTITKSIPTVG
jgi:hypothetical protein